MKKLLIMSVAVWMLVLAGCEQPNKPTKVGEGETDQSSAAEELLEEFEIGDEVRLGDQVLTVHGISTYTENVEWLQPESGNTYKAVEVSIRNDGEGPIDYHPWEFKLRDDRGYSFDVSVFGNKKPTLEGGTLPPGELVRGFITYQVLNDAQGLELYFKPNWWQKSMIVVKLD